jgi:uncharacterized protein (TIRG00374 family)
MSSDPAAPALDASGAPRSSRRSTILKILVTLTLYVLVFSFKVDLGELGARLRTVDLTSVALGVLVYASGQWLSAFKWHLMLRPVQLAVPYLRMVAFYFTGMFFNIFLPTIVGGDAVKAILLARETGSPARATMSVFMERNTGLLALLTIATVAAWFAPPVPVLGLTLFTLTLVLFGCFIAANLVLADKRAYRFVDYVIAITPLARMRSRASSLYEAIVPYRRDVPMVVAGVLLSFVFQAVVILVVFLNAKALDQTVPMAALAVFVPLISLAGMLPVSVNGLGIREVLYVLLFGRVGIPSDAAAAMALLYFVVTLAASLPGGVVYMLQRSPRRPPIPSSP